MKKCFVCGYTVVSNGFTNKMLEENGNIVIVKEIPCLVCANCGEIYFETSVMLKLEKIILHSPGELEIINFQKVA